MSAGKPKLAMYWGASCGGCEIALANINEVLLEVDEHFDFVFCPCLLDTKRSDIEALPDGSIFLTLFNGALRTAENLEMAELLRRKSQLLIAFGSCAVSGGIPGLGNQHGIAHILQTAFINSPGIDNPDNIIPGTHTQVPDGVLELPPFLQRVLALHEAVAIDYSIPGCPPESEQIIAVIRLVASGAPLPEKGSMLGCTSRAVCDDCPRAKRGVPAPGLVRTFEIIPEPGWCLVEQGVACVGSAIRGGCGALCPIVAMPCTGCYGAIDRTGDPGAAVLTALAAAVDFGETVGKDEAAVHRQIAQVMAGVADPLGTCYRYSLADTVVADREPEVES